MSAYLQKRPTLGSDAPQRPSTSFMRRKSDGRTSIARARLGHCTPWMPASSLYKASAVGGFGKSFSTIYAADSIRTHSRFEIGRPLRLVLERATSKLLRSTAHCSIGSHDSESTLIGLPDLSWPTIAS